MSNFNLHIPLASSYNPRGENAAVLSNITSGYDQRKVNSLYEIGSNPVTGKSTPYLVKRPGVTAFGLGLGSNTQTQYLGFDLTVGIGAVIVKDTSNNNKAITLTNSSTTILNSSSYNPCFASVVDINNTATAVVQFRAAATAVQRVFYATALNSWSEITDGDFTTLGHRGKMESLNGRLLTMAATTPSSTDQWIYASNLNDLANWDPTAKIKKSIQQDIAIGLAMWKGQVLAFGAQSCERFVDVGNPIGSPLSRMDAASNNLKVGLEDAYLSGTTNGPTNYAAMLGEVLYFMGRIGGVKCLAAYNGQSFEKVSSAFMDKILQADTIYSVNVFQFLGHKAIALQRTSPTLSSGSQKWWLFFPEHKEFFEWESTEYSPVPYHGLGASGGIYLGALTGAGGSTTNDLMYFNPASPDVYRDNSQTITQTHQFRVPGEDGARHFLDEYGVVGDTVSSSDYSIALSRSDDGTYETAQTIDMSKPKKTISRGGSFYKLDVKITHTANGPGRLQEFIGRVK